MIISKLQGGLGNQLFQWAYGEALSVEHNTSLVLDLGNYTKTCSNITPRSYELHKFPYIKTDNGKSNNKPIIFVHDIFRYKKLDYDDNYSYYLDGYWQSEKYFITIRNTIVEKLQRPKEVTKNDTGISVSLHVRRTDYLTSNNFHIVQNINYYNSALDIIGEYDKLYIFSDDIEWCKKNLKYHNMVFLNQSNVEDLWSMASCDHNIIANSSFSWWGAWLNTNPNKIVVAPKNWFGNNDIDTTDILPSSWIKT